LPETGDSFGDRGLRRFSRRKRIAGSCRNSPSETRKTFWCAVGQIQQQLSDRECDPADLPAGSRYPAVSLPCARLDPRLHDRLVKPLRLVLHGRPAKSQKELWEPLDLGMLSALPLSRVDVPLTPIRTPASAVEIALPRDAARQQRQNARGRSGSHLAAAMPTTAEAFVDLPFMEPGPRPLLKTRARMPSCCSIGHHSKEPFSGFRCGASITSSAKLMDMREHP